MFVRVYVLENGTGKKGAHEMNAEQTNMRNIRADSGSLVVFTVGRDANGCHRVTSNAHT